MRWLYRSSIKTKLIAGFLAVALLSGAVGAVGIYNMHRLERSGFELYSSTTLSLQQIAGLADRFVEAYRSFAEKRNGLIEIAREVGSDEEALAYQKAEVYGAALGVLKELETVKQMEVREARRQKRPTASRPGRRLRL